MEWMKLIFYGGIGWVDVAGPCLGEIIYSLWDLEKYRPQGCSTDIHHCGSSQVNPAVWKTPYVPILLKRTCMKFGCTQADA
jgi:hypothetical protein